MRKRKYIILISILFLTIGFATITTTLIFNVMLRIGTDNSDFDRNVIFTRAETDSGGSSTISSDGKSIAFTSKELKDLYETFVLDFDLTNNSRQYEAEATIECSKVDAQSFQ